MSSESLKALSTRIRTCNLCQAELPLGPRPVFRVNAKARILIASQAPGIRVHESGIPFNDPSGDTLRGWLGIDREVFYDETRIAIMPTGFCYPGKGKSGDAPPRPECAPLWHPKLRPLLPGIELTLLIGAYAQAYYLGDRREKTLAATVKKWRDFLPDFLPTPHPSPRNKLWLKQNPWFEAEVVPELQARVARILGL